MLLRQTALKTALLATTADDTRSALNAVHVRPDGVVEATDGHILVRWTVNVGTIDAKPYAVATDLDTPLVVARERTNDGASCPTTDRVMIKEGDRAVIKVVLSAAMLQTLARIGKEVGANGATNTVTLEIPTDAEYLDKRTGSVVAGIRFTAGDGDVRADGVVMPCRL